MNYTTEKPADTTAVDKVINTVSTYAQAKLKPLGRTPAHVALTCATVLLSISVLKIAAVVIGFVFLPVLVISALGTVLFTVATLVTSNNWNG